MSGGFGNFLEDTSLHWHSFLCRRLIVHAVACALNRCVLLHSEIIKGVFPVSVKVEQSVDVLFSVSIPAFDSGCTFPGQFKAC